jgi:hypothetical protein
MIDQGTGQGQGYGPQQQGGSYNGAWQQGDRNRDAGRMGRGWRTGSGMMSRFWDMFSNGRMSRGWGMGSGCR